VHACVLVYGLLELCVPLHQTLQVGVISGMVFLPFGQTLEAVETDPNDQELHSTGHKLLRTHTLCVRLIAFEF
jgi:hypothetical protein